MLCLAAWLIVAATAAAGEARHADAVDVFRAAFSKPRPNSLRFQNFFPQGVGGSLTIVVPQAERADER